MSQSVPGRYGEAGKSLGSANATGKFGYQNTKAGMIGERYLDNAIRKDPFFRSLPLWRSLRIPASGNKRYESDVDMAVASGNRLVLIDAKMWAANRIYWTFLGRPMRGFKPMKNKMSRNMELAVTRYSKELPGCMVTGVVIFLPTPSGLPSSVFALRWPGGIKSYLPSDGLRAVQKALGTPETVDPSIQGLLGRMTR